MSEGLSNKVGNVMGVPLPLPLRVQLQMRSAKNMVIKGDPVSGIYSTERDTDNVKYLANKSGWVRLVSSIDIYGEDLQYFANKVPIGQKLPSDLAKSFVLSAGTSIYQNEENNGFSYLFREGVSEEGRGAYGNIAGKNEISDYGYRPMPGITEVKVQTQGKLGSIRQATIDIKVWTKDQLDIIDALYFKMGYHMFLEWGHAYYYNNQGVLTQMGPTIDPFKQGLTKEQLLTDIARKKQESDCNYDAMLGMCTHFTYAFNQEGGYDCTIKLIGMGTLADSLKINSTANIPDVQKQEIETFYNVYAEYKKQQAIAEAGKDNDPTPPPKSAGSAQSFLAVTASLPNYQQRIVKTSIGDDVVIIPEAIPNSQIPDGGIYLLKKNIFMSPIDAIAKKWYTGIKLNAAPIKIAKNKIKEALSKKPIKDEDIGYETRAARTKYYDNGVILMYNARNDGSDEAYFRVTARYTADTNDQFREKYVYEFVIDLQSSFISKKTNKVYDIYVNGDKKNKYIIESLQGDGYGINEKKFKDFSDQAVLYFDQVLLSFLNYGEDYSVSVFAPDKTLNIANVKGKNRINTAYKDVATMDKIILSDSNDRFVSNGKLGMSFMMSFKWPLPFGFNTVQVFRDSATQANTGNQEETKQGLYDVYIITNDAAVIDDIVTDNNSFQIQDRLNAKNEAAALAKFNAEKEQLAKDREAIGEQVEKSIKKESFQYPSALESSLRIIQLHSLNAAVGSNNPNFDFREVKVCNLAAEQTANSGSIADTIFSNSLFRGKINDFIKSSNQFDNVDEWVLKGLYPNATKRERLLSYAAYGYNHNLLASADQPQFVSENEMKTCDFEKMFTTYVVPYDISKQVLDDVDQNHPVYIRLDLLLFLINGMCMLYDSPSSPRSSASNNSSNQQGAPTSGATLENQTPVLYIDFNTHTNMCLSSPLHMSIDAKNFLIPFRGSDEGYKMLFKEEHLKAIYEGAQAWKKYQEKQSQNTDESETDVVKESVPPIDELFTPSSKEAGKGDAISNKLPEFKNTETATGAWSGNIMKIVISVDYILSLLQSFSSNDDAHSVNLRPFVEQLLSDLNKSLGDINVFRFAYKDESNCFYITDDQTSPMPGKDQYPSQYQGKEQIEKYGDLEMNRSSIELPLFGRRSIAKNLEIRTEVASKLSNMLAISANANTKSATGKDSTAFGQYNSNFVNRYSNELKEIDADAKQASEGEKQAAIAFNDYVKSIFSSENPKFDQINAAMNYYIEKMNAKKAEYIATRAAAMIPVSVNFETDGISGFSMGQAFTLPPQLLPYTYQRYETENGTRIGFAMTGVEDTISSNAWNTSVKASMFFMKDEKDFPNPKSQFNAGQLVEASFAGSSDAASSTSAVGSSNTNYSGTNPEARKSIETYIGRSISDDEFKDLISATFAESSRNQREEAHVMATIINRARISGKTISAELRKKNQFQSVTGTNANGHRPSSNFVNGPTAKAADSIYGAAINILPSIAKNIQYFTAANIKAYGPGTNPGYMEELKKRGGFIVGQTIFSA